MRTSEVKYRRVKNLGNYESEEFALTLAPEEGTAPESAMEHAKGLVCNALGLSVSAPPLIPAETKKPAAAKPAASKPAAEKPAKEEKKPAGTRKPKTVKYDRGTDKEPNSAHTNQLAELLNKHFPDWKKAPGVAAAKEVSQALQGEEFLSNKGEVLPSFVKLLKEKMTEKAAGESL